jgi:hypothetical protein
MILETWDMSPARLKIFIMLTLYYTLFGLGSIKRRCFYWNLVSCFCPGSLSVSEQAIQWNFVRAFVLECDWTTVCTPYSSWIRHGFVKCKLILTSEPNIPGILWLSNGFFSRHPLSIRKWIRYLRPWRLWFLKLTHSTEYNVGVYVNTACRSRRCAQVERIVTKWWRMFTIGCWCAFTRLKTTSIFLLVDTAQTNCSRLCWQTDMVIIYSSIIVITVLLNTRACQSITSHHTSSILRCLLLVLRTYTQRLTEPPSHSAVLFEGAPMWQGDGWRNAFGREMMRDRGMQIGVGFGFGSLYLHYMCIPMWAAGWCSWTDRYYVDSWNNYTRYD